MVRLFSEFHMLVLVRGVQSGAISGRVRKLGFSPPLFAPSPLKEVVTNLRKGRANEDVTEIRKQQQLPGYYHHKWFSGPNLTQKRRIIRLFSVGGFPTRVPFLLFGQNPMRRL